jgi:hypothetical protein
MAEIDRRQLLDSGLVLGVETAGPGAVEVENAEDRALMREAASQAMWPGKALTSSTRIELPRSTAVPQTPSPTAMRTQAGLPWNGPTTSSSSECRK